MSALAHIVALSGGKDSTAMALRLAEVSPGVDFQFCYTPTGRELPAMVEHWERLECPLGKALVKVPGPSMADLIVKYRALPNWRMRWCTRQIKIEPFQVYAMERAPAICYVGIRPDEIGRDGSDHSGIEGVTQECPLVTWGWGLAQVLEYLGQRGVTVPLRTDCDFCFFQRLAEWWRLWRDHPDRFTEAEAYETWTGHTFRSAQRDSWPASLKEMRVLFEAGRVPKGANQENLALGVASRPSMCAWCAR